MIKYWEFLSRIGIDQSISAQSAKKITLTNQLAIILGLLAFLYIFLFWALGLPAVAGWTILAMGLYLSPIIFNHFKLHIASSTWFIFVFNSILVCFSYLLGKGSGIYLICLGNICLPWLFFSLKHKGYILLGSLVSVAAFTFVDIMEVKPIMDLTTEIQKIIYSSIIYLVVFPFLSLCFYSFMLQNQRVEKKLIEKNTFLSKAKEELLALDKAKTDFFTNISHEFRTPLTLMLGPIEDLINDDGLQLERHQKAELFLIRNNTIRLQELVSNLLDFSKLEAGRMESFFEESDLDGLVKEHSNLFKPAIDRVGLSFEVKVRPLSKKVFIDREKFQLIINNLLSNALKYTFSGGVTVQLEEEQSFAVLSVTDSGGGIDRESQEKIFEKFYRSSKMQSRSIEGTGIGLAFTKELVKIHGGRIEVQSELNKGSIFRVYFPFGKEHLDASQVSLSPKGDFLTKKHFIDVENIDEDVRVTSNKSFNKIADPNCSNILIVEDNRDMRVYLHRILERQASWNVISVGNGIEALALIEQEKPDLVVSDVMMPEMDGFELLHQIRAIKKLQGLPIILLSARAGEESTVEGLDRGADDYMVKPFSAKELIARIRTHLSLARARESNEVLISLVKERSLEMEQMTYIASHDLKAPLNSLGSLINLLKDHYSSVLDERGRTCLAHADKTVKLSVSLITSLLDFSDVSSSEKLEFVDCETLIREVLMDLKSDIEAKHVEVNISKLPEIEAYPIKIRLLFQNILSNAVKFNHPERQHKIFVSASSTAKYTEFRVRDNGIGIAEKDFKKVFQFFKRLNNKEKYVGNGIGLAHCKKIVEIHRGKIWIESTPNLGTTFVFTISHNLVDRVLVA